MKVLQYLILTIGAGAVLFQMVSVRYLFQTFNQQKLMHICIGFVLLSLTIIKKALEGEADLIILGTHGRTGLDHVLFGSTAEKVVRKSPIPVMTIRIKE